MKKPVECCHYLIMGEQGKTSNIVDLKIKKRKIVIYNTPCSSLGQGEFKDK